MTHFLGDNMEEMGGTVRQPGYLIQPRPLSLWDSLPRASLELEVVLSKEAYSLKGRLEKGPLRNPADSLLERPCDDDTAKPHMHSDTCVSSGSAFISSKHCLPPAPVRAIRLCSNSPMGED